MKKSFLLVLFLSVIFCSFAEESSYAVVSNIPYYSEAVSQNDPYMKERCILDVYYKKETKGCPTVVWIHGGGLEGGSKEIPAELKDKGFCVVGVEYRLSPKVKSPKYVEDAAAAVAWVFKNIEKYGGDPSLIFLTGHSAGGYLSTMVGMDKKYLNVYGIDANKIAGLIPFSGQMITHYTIRKERGISELQAVIDSMAPVFHVRADASPLLLMTGDRELELYGRYEENAYMMRMMKLIGHKQTRLLEFDGYGHGMAQPAFPLLIEEVKKITKQIKGQNK